MFECSWRNKPVPNIFLDDVAIAKRVVALGGPLNRPCILMPIAGYDANLAS